MHKSLLVTIVLCMSMSFVALLGNPVMAETDYNTNTSTSTTTTSSSTNTSNSNVVVQTIPGPSLSQKIVDRTKASWPWYVVRGSGIIAALALVILMLSGMGIVTGQTFRFMEPLTAWASHRALGIVFAVSIVLHMVGLLFDHFVPFDLLNLLVPWLSNYKPVSIFGLQLGSLWVALGVLSFYGAVLITITSLLWIEKKPYLWKLIHLLSYMIMAFVFIHALYLGTDLANGFLRWLWIALGAVVAIFVIVRLRRAKTI